METSETRQLQVTALSEGPPRLEIAPAPDAEPAFAAASAPEFACCDDCGAPVDHAQRYCVNCGAHRRHVPDPAARYLSQASTRPGPRTARSAYARRRGASLASAAVLALIPVAAAVGVEIGRSSNSQDSKLIQELARQRTQTVLSSTPVAASDANGRPSSADGSAKPHRASRGHTSSRAAATSATAGGGKVVSKTQYGTATQLTGSKVTNTEASQGASEAKTIQNSTGKSYVQAAQNLPSTVVP